MKLFFLSILFICLSGSNEASAQTNKEQSLRTKNKNVKLIQDLIQKNYEFYLQEPNRIFIKSKDPCGFEAPVYKPNKDGLRQVSLGSKLCLKVDKFGDQYAMIEEIKEDKLILSYTHSSDQTKSEKNQLHIDTGTVEVKLKKSSVTSEQGSDKK